MIRHAFCAMAIGFALTPLALGRAAANDPGLDLLRERQQAEALRRLRTAPQGAGVEAPAAPTAKSQICFPIRTIAVDGATVFDAVTFSALARPFRERCLGQNEIEQLIGVVRNAYVSRGYITTQVVVPAQDLKNGHLRLQVVEGRVSRLVYGILRDGEKPSVAWAGKQITAFPFLIGGVLNLRDLEQGVAQINRAPSRAAAIDILPGDTPGTSIVRVIEQDQRWWRLSAGLDSNGQTVTGVNRLRLGAEFDDLLAVNDNWSFSYADALSSNAVAATVSVPFGAWTLSNSLSYSEQDTPIGDVADLVSQSANEAISLDRVFYRSANLVLHANQSLNWYWGRRYINETQLQPQYLAWERSGLTAERFFDTARLSFDLGVSLGAPFLAHAANANAPGDDGPSAHFGKIDATLTYLQSLPRGFSLLATATGQYSGQSLYSANQISIGGWDSVRGFRDSGLSGDSGYYLRTELQWASALPWARAADDPLNGKPVAAPWSDVSPAGLTRQIAASVSPYVFADGGTVYASNTGKSQSLASAGVGLRAYGERTTFEATLAVPVLAGNTGAGVQTSLSMTVKLW